MPIYVCSIHVLRIFVEQRVGGWLVDVGWCRVGVLGSWVAVPVLCAGKRASDPPRTRTRNLRLRSLTPYPLGKRADIIWVALLSHQDCPALPGRTGCHPLTLRSWGNQLLVQLSVYLSIFCVVAGNIICCRLASRHQMFQLIHR